MFTKALNYSYYRLLSKCLSNNRLFCSQVVKTNEDLVKVDSQKTSEKTLEKTSEKTSVKEVKPNQQMSESLTHNERQVLAKVVRSPVEMDSFWEIRTEEQKLKPKKIIDKTGISVDFMAALVHKWDFSFPGIKRRIKYYITIREVYNQRYITKRHAILGPELASAHFVVYRGGSVRFKHAPEKWVNKYEVLPNVYDEKYRLTAVDASGETYKQCLVLLNYILTDLKLRYEALDNFCLLDSLEELNLSKNRFLDDFMCDKIARLFRNSKHLSVLDLSDNPLITHRGVETLHRIRSLRQLNISGTKAAKYPFIELLVILFNDINPLCEIIIEK